MRFLKFLAAAALAFGLARPVAAQTIDDRVGADSALQQGLQGNIDEA